LEEERYLDLVTSLPVRKAITKVRVSDHNFQVDIEKGRKKKIERQNRVCQLCKSGFIGTEFHVVMQCAGSELGDLRKKTIEQLYLINPSFEKFINLEQMF
jgi:hypothetical protein